TCISGSGKVGHPKRAALFLFHRYGISSTVGAEMRGDVRGCRDRVEGCWTDRRTTQRALWGAAVRIGCQPSLTSDSVEPPLAAGGRVISALDARVPESDRLPRRGCGGEGFWGRMGKSSRVKPGATPDRGLTTTC